MRKNTLRDAVLAALLVFSCHVQAQATVDWSVWDRLLAANVAEGEVNYAGLRQNPAFTALLAGVARASTDNMDREQQLAFYINAYNVLVASAILEGRSPATRWSRIGFFSLDKYTVAGRRLSLKNLEKKVILPMGEPRAHFALVCASRSCPKLRAEAYDAGRLDAQLDDNARDFIADSSKNRFDPEQRVAWVSSIFKWYQADFETDGSLQDYLANYVLDPEVARLLRDQAFEIRYLDYDWSLNGTLASP